MGFGFFSRSERIGWKNGQVVPTELVEAVIMVVFISCFEAKNTDFVFSIKYFRNSRSCGYILGVWSHLRGSG